MGALPISIPPLPPEAMDQHHSLKLRFAAVYLKLRDATKAAMQVCEPGMALQVADRWLYDPVVIGEMDRIATERPEALLPSKDEILIDIKKRADLASTRASEYVALMELYCKIRDFIPKPGTSVTEVKVQVQSVMVVPSQGSDADWERRSGTSQQRLIASATA